MRYQAPWWLPGGHFQTIWAARVSRTALDPTPSSPLADLRFVRERWDTPDGDFIDIDWLADTHGGMNTGSTLLVMFHGLEGNSQSHYSQGLAQAARARGWAFAIPHFRGCSGELNRAPRAYHSGDHAEIDWILKRMRARHGQAVHAVGISLGGNALMRWAGEYGTAAEHSARAVVSVCSPLDLEAGGQAMGRGFNRQVYTRMFLHTMKPKALQKLAQHPGLFDRERLIATRDLYDFDNVFTAPLHGFRNTEDYWRRASAKPYLRAVCVPALVLNALNDPFVPAWSLPEPTQVSANVQLWQPAQGGHVGFAAGRWPGHVMTMPEAVCDWLTQHA